MPPRAPIPVTLLTGFLGAGKTTLLERFLAHEQAAGRVPGVLMNDFGELGIDTQLIDQRGPIRELTGGCICCSLQDDLVLTLTALAEEAVSRLFVECSGVADPLDIVDALTSPAMLERYRLEAVVAVVDAGNFTLWAASQEVMRCQVAFADWILLNKSDLVPTGALVAIESTLRSWNAQASLRRTINAEVDPALLATPAVAVRPTLPERAGITAAGYHVARVAFPEPVSRQALEAWMAALPASVLRGKGFVRLDGETDPFVVQIAGTQRGVYRLPYVREVPLEVVLIGTGLESAAIAGRWGEPGKEAS